MNNSNCQFIHDSEMGLSICIESSEEGSGCHVSACFVKAIDCGHDEPFFLDNFSRKKSRTITQQRIKSFIEGNDRVKYVLYTEMASKDIREALYPLLNDVKANCGDLLALERDDLWIDIHKALSAQHGIRISCELEEEVEVVAGS